MEMEKGPVWGGQPDPETEAEVGELETGRQNQIPADRDTGPEAE